MLVCALCFERVIATLYLNSTGQQQTRYISCSVRFCSHSYQAGHLTGSHATCPRGRVVKGFGTS